MPRALCTSFLRNQFESISRLSFSFTKLKYLPGFCLQAAACWLIKNEQSTSIRAIQKIKMGFYGKDLFLCLHKFSLPRAIDLSSAARVGGLINIK